MAKKYLSIEEAAEQLGMETEELNRLRESGELRGFADRGTWKFKIDDIENLERSRQADSNPEVPLLDDADTADSSIISSASGGAKTPSAGDSSLILGSDYEGDDGSTVIRKGNGSGASDSDVRLILDDKLVDDLDDSHADVELNLRDSDSDVRLVDDQSEEDDSDSDVKLVDSDSDSDVRLAEGDPSGSDSDVQLIASDSDTSDSDVQLIGGDMRSDSDVRLMADDRTDSDVALVTDDDSVLSDEDSGIHLKSADSGISLETPADSGISLMSDDDSGIGFAAESGISLESPTDSGIALVSDDDDELNESIPMLDSNSEEHDEFDQTAFEVPSLEDESGDTEFELADEGDSADDTSVILFDDDEDSAAATVAKKSADDDGLEDDEFEDFGDDELVADDVIGEDDELDELDVFDADDDDFEESFHSGESHAEFVAPLAGAGRGVPAADADWGTGTFIGLTVSSVVLLLCGLIMFDLVNTMWHWGEANPVSGTFVETFSGLFQ
jgi:hypothetical protein